MNDNDDPAEEPHQHVRLTPTPTPPDTDADTASEVVLYATEGVQGVGNYSSWRCDRGRIASVCPIPMRAQRSY